MMAWILNLSSNNRPLIGASKPPDPQNPQIQVHVTDVSTPGSHIHTLSTVPIKFDHGNVGSGLAPVVLIHGHLASKIYLPLLTKYQ